MPRMCSTRSVLPAAAGVAGSVLLAAGAAGQGISVEPVVLVTPTLSLEGALEQYAGRPWKVQLEPMLWWTSPSGKVKLPGGGSGGGGGGGGGSGSDEVRVARLNLDTPRASPLGEVHVNADPWLVSLGGSAFSLSRDDTTADSAFSIGGVAVAEGDSLDVSFDYATAELTIGRLIFRRDYDALSLRPEDATPVRLSVYALGGARLYDLDVSVANRSRGGMAASQQVFIEPMIGVRAVTELARDFTIDLQMSGGYYTDSDRSVSSLDISVGFMWRPHENVGVQLGWRQLLSWMEDGEDAEEFSYAGGLAGLYAGVVVWF